MVPLGRAGLFVVCNSLSPVPQIRVRSLDANLGFHRVTHVLRFSGGAAFDRVGSTSLTSPSWIRQGATHRARAVARSGSPAPDMYFRVSLKVTPKCKNPYVVGHAR